MLCCRMQRSSFIDLVCCDKSSMSRFSPDSYDRMLDTRGNTAVYLQFAHARLASILRKAQDELQVDLAALKASPEKVSVEHDAERALAFELLVFSDVVEVSFTVKA